MVYKLKIKKINLSNINKNDFNFIQEALPKITKNNWNWEYLGSKPKGYSFIAEINGKNVAHNSFLVAKFILNKKILLVAKSEGSYAKAELIKKITGKNEKVFGKLVKKALQQMKKEGIFLAYGFPNHLGHKSYLFGGYTLKNAEIYNSNLISNFNYYFYKNNHRLNFFLKILLKIVNMIWKTFLLKPLLLLADKKINSVVSISPKDFIKIESLFYKVSEKFPRDYLAVVRSKAYLKWRYLNNPYKKYYFYGLHNNNNLEGVVIFNILTQTNYKNLEIKDLLYKNEKTLGILLGFILKWCIKKKISLITMWEDSTSLNTVSRKILFKNGFFRNRIKLRKRIIISILGRNKKKNYISLELKKYLERT